MRKTPRLGQHLLTNNATARAVALAAGAARGTRVLEIGPGTGILTAELLALGAIVTAVEKDTAMVAVLNEKFSDELSNGQLTVIEGDARTVTPDTAFPVGSYVVAANIPYYITGELIRIFLTAENQPSSIALLVQKEVAERIVGPNPDARSGPRLKRRGKESILSLSVKVYGTPRYIKTVKRGNFNPPPKVDSAILSIYDISRNNFKNISEKRFFEVVKAGFAQKRKTLAGNLKRAFGNTLGVPDKIRAEDVPLEKWLELAER